MGVLGFRVLGLQSPEFRALGARDRCFRVQGLGE